MLGRIYMNNIVWIFEEAFIWLQLYTERTPLVKLNKETGDPRARSPRRAGPGWVRGRGRVETRRVGGVEYF
jgi:hypothetical protein